MLLADLDSEGHTTDPQVLGTGTFPSEAVSGGGKTALVWIASSSRVARFWSDGNWAGEQFTIAENGMWGQTMWTGNQFAAAWQDPDYHSHWTTFDVDGNLSPSEEFFPDEECVGPKLASNGEGQALLNCVRYDADYARRLVNYVLGEPLPDTDPPTEPLPEPDAAPDGTPAEPEPSPTDSTDDDPAAGGGGTDDPSSNPGGETVDPTETPAEEPESPSGNAPVAEGDAGGGAAVDGGTGDTAEEQNPRTRGSGE
jgi:hypothetical protein